jgi:hypothetical protein
VACNRKAIRPCDTVAGVGVIRPLLCLMLTGCAAPQVYNIERKTVTVTVVEVKGLPTLGRASWGNNGMCFIALREYPKCLQHEMRHCLEGKWHDEKPNDEGCY